MEPLSSTTNLEDIIKIFRAKNPLKETCFNSTRLNVTTNKDRKWKNKV